MEFFDPGDFIPIFRQMGLDGQVVLFTEMPKAGHQFFRCRRDEARRGDEADAVQFLLAADGQFFRVGQGLVCIF